MKAAEAAKLFEKTAPIEMGIPSDRDAGVFGELGEFSFMAAR